MSESGFRIRISVTSSASKLNKLLYFINTENISTVSDLVRDFRKRYEEFLDAEQNKKPSVYLEDCSIFYDESIRVLREDDLVELRFSEEDPASVNSNKKKRKRSLNNHIDSILVYNEKQKNGKNESEEECDAPKPKKKRKQKTSEQPDLSDCNKVTKKAKVIEPSTIKPENHKKSKKEKHKVPKKEVKNDSSGSSSSDSEIFVKSPVKKEKKVNGELSNAQAESSEQDKTVPEEAVEEFIPNPIKKRKRRHKKKVPEPEVKADAPMVAYTNHPVFFVPPKVKRNKHNYVKSKHTHFEESSQALTGETGNGMEIKDGKPTENVAADQNTSQQTRNVPENQTKPKANNNEDKFTVKPAMIPRQIKSAEQRCVIPVSPPIRMRPPLNYVKSNVAPSLPFVPRKFSPQVSSTPKPRIVVPHVQKQTQVVADDKFQDWSSNLMMMVNSGGCAFTRQSQNPENQRNFSVSKNKQLADVQTNKSVILTNTENTSHENHTFQNDNQSTNEESSKKEKEGSVPAPLEEESEQSLFNRSEVYKPYSKETKSPSSSSSSSSTTSEEAEEPVPKVNGLEATAESSESKSAADAETIVKETDEKTEPVHEEPPPAIKPADSKILPSTDDKEMYPEDAKYKNFPLVLGEPTINCIIAFKILEMTPEYIPVISPYREAQVQSYCPTTAATTLALVNGAMNMCSMEAAGVDTEADRPTFTVNWGDIINARNIFP